jgi:hypothetical protein
MHQIKDILATILIFLIIGMVVSVSFIFALVIIPITLIGVIYCYVKDERNSQRLG